MLVDDPEFLKTKTNKKKFTTNIIGKLYKTGPPLLDQHTRWLRFDNAPFELIKVVKKTSTTCYGVEQQSTAITTSFDLQQRLVTIW